MISRGSIPASAGEPPLRQAVAGPVRVYPRECGGTTGVLTFGTTGVGLSPRVRGNRLRPDGAQRQRGSIPASAGEPAGAAGFAAVYAVYPRECGGTGRYLSRRKSLCGLSPRVRGNLFGHRGQALEVGSIPASAGEPGFAVCNAFRREVYPRECGGTGGIRFSGCCPEGLSPRVRGNPCRWRPGLVARRSIPASAGEPAPAGSISIPAAVYPRECGGTPGTKPTPPKLKGLSPRVRGNPVHQVKVQYSLRSIPASAGEPGVSKAASSQAKVYPRECGGTSIDSEGNPYTEVYPRECGGTAIRLGSLETEQGLSPRVRGNPGTDEDPRPWAGSIPASAGEPGSAGPGTRAKAVYPRECGGTNYSGIVRILGDGLSPRVRGNRVVMRIAPIGCRSIPASAGEPR